MPEEQVLIGGALVFRDRGKKTSWLVVKPEDENEWQLPKGLVFREESSVRAVMRTLGKIAGLRSAIIEEVGRTNSTTARKGTSLSRRVIYYLVQLKGKAEEGEMSMPIKLQWLKFASAKTRLGTANEKKMLIEARSMLSEWRKKVAN